jgi:hypothetical protein
MKINIHLLRLLCSRPQLFNFQFLPFLIMQVMPSFAMHLGNQIPTLSRLLRASASSSRWVTKVTIADISLSRLCLLLCPHLYRLKLSVFFSPPS